MSASGQFVWVTHQVPATRWLKAEVARDAPTLRFAFARPGLTTFKVDGGAAGLDTLVPSAFTRASGLSLGRASSAAEVLVVAAPMLVQAGAGAPVRLHVFERDVDVPVDEQDAAVRGSRATSVAAAVRAAAGGDRFDPEVRARPGDLVIDVIVPHGSEPDEPWLVGAHRHDGRRGPWPGGVDHVPPPAEAPSRAWCKAEEALRWADLEPRPGQIAVELGSSPGGASYALLCRGLTVYGVDPGEMAPIVRDFRGPHGNRFVHLHQPAAEVPRAALPRQYQWLFNDVNLAPMVALRYVERFVALSHGGLRGAVLTLKVNDDGIAAALPRLLERVRKLGGRELRVTQLPSHRSEVVAIATW
ncbi:MAG: hypothetical protein KA297_10805 [Kofleriaceae bacterium]|nr:hypothetical protein [Kofleriaceae bacterium]MBP6838381.1 hypothetical protein [Kofleriaceae bacterium]